jgi:ABC-type transporter Mla subunit MlaD
MSNIAKTSPTPVVAANGSGFTARLAAPRKEIERDFLRMGEQLIACTRLVNETSESYARMAGTLAGPDFSELTGSLERLSELVAGLDRDRIVTQAFLKELDDIAEQFPGRIGALTRAVRTLRMFFVTARTAAATTGKREDKLLKFVEEFTTLGNQLESSVASFADTFGRMRGSLDAASDMNARFGDQHAELLGSIAAEQMRNLEVMDRCRLWAERRVTVHSERSDTINERVTRAVSTLQVGDSTRQRVEHVEEILKKLNEIDDATAVSVVHTLASAQLRGAIEDFDGETGALATALQDLVRSTQTMLDAAAADSDTLLANGDSALGAIESSLHEIARMLEQYERSNAALLVAIDQLVAAVGNMLEHMSAFDDIRQTVRILSLNATLRSRALGEDGRAFRQVAADLRILNDETDAPVAEVMERLEKSEAVLRGFLDSRASNDESRTNAVQELLDAARWRVGEIVRHLRDDAAFMAEAGPRALAQLRDAAETATDRRDFCAEWRTVGEELAEIAEEPGLHSAVTDEQADLIADIYSIYSMNAEREIHRNLLGMGGTEESPSNGEEKDTFDDIFF